MYGLTWDNRVGNKKLLVTRDNKRHEKIYGYMLENKKSNRDTSRKFNSKWNTREAIDIFDSRLYYKVIINNRERYNFSSV